MTKADKDMGKPLARDLKKVDAEGVTPAKTLHPVTKRYGYAYEYSFFGKRWSKQSVWFKTERSRDQSMSKFSRGRSEHIRNIIPVYR